MKYINQCVVAILLIITMLAGCSKAQALSLKSKGEKIEFAESELVEIATMLPYFVRGEYEERSSVRIVEATCLAMFYNQWEQDYLGGSPSPGFYTYPQDLVIEYAEIIFNVKLNMSEIKTLDFGSQWIAAFPYEDNFGFREWSAYSDLTYSDLTVFYLSDSYYKITFSVTKSSPLREFTTKGYAIIKKEPDSPFHWQHIAYYDKKKDQGR